MLWAPDVRDTMPPSLRRRGYIPPSRVVVRGLRSMLELSGRGSVGQRQLDLLRSPRSAPDTADVDLYCAGDLDLLRRPCVSIVGTREVSEAGRLRAKRLARELVERGIVIASGLARGVDHAAHTSALEAGGRTVAIIGTALDKAYPAENAGLQEEIYRRHLLVSPFRPGETVFRSNFPKRNRVMALLSDATVIVEASDTSGTLHQAAECQRHGRWLFIMRSVAEDPALAWPRKFIGRPMVQILESTQQIVDLVTK